jgi:hypothetical protein
MAARTFQRIYGQGGGYGQTGPGLNFDRGVGPEPYRVPISPDAGGFHGGSYEADHYREPSEREPGSRQDQYRQNFDDRPLNIGHRGKGPRNYRRPDLSIEEEINEQLTAAPDLDPTEIIVNVEGGDVTLTGYVDSLHAKRRAEEIAEEVPGVRRVQNNLRIRKTDWTPPFLLRR